MTFVEDMKRLYTYIHVSMMLNGLCSHVFACQGGSQPQNPMMRHANSAEKDLGRDDQGCSNLVKHSQTIDHHRPTHVVF